VCCVWLVVVISVDIGIWLVVLVIEVFVMLIVLILVLIVLSRVVSWLLVVLWVCRCIGRLNCSRSVVISVWVVGACSRLVMFLMVSM